MEGEALGSGIRGRINIAGPEIVPPSLVWDQQFQHHLEMC